MRVRLFLFNGLYAALFLLGATGCILDSEGPQPDEIFVKFYGGEGTDELVDIGHIASEDAYILLGNSNSFSPNGISDIYLVKTDNQGNLLDELRFDLGNNDSTSDVAASLEVLDNQFLVVGSTETINANGVFENKRIFYAVVDFNFTVQSSDTISIDGIDVEGNDIIQTSDGDLLILATTGELTDVERDLYYIKFSQDGILDWERTNPLPGTDVGVSIIELGNGDFAICALTDRTSVRGYGGINALYLVVNDLGLLKNSLAFGNSSGGSTIIDDIPTKMIQDASGATIIGNSLIGGVEEPFVIPLNANGAIDSLRPLANIPNQSDIVVNDVVRSLNGDYIMTGNFNNYVLTADENDNTPKGQQILFLRTDQLGTSNLTSSHHGDGFNDSGEAILQLPDGQILIGGTISFGASVTKMVLMKVNSSGELL